MVSGFPHMFSPPPQRRNYTPAPKMFLRCKNVLKGRRDHHAKYGGAPTSPVAGVAKNVDLLPQNAMIGQGT